MAASRRPPNILLLFTDQQRAAAYERRLVAWEREDGLPSSLDGDRFVTFPATHRDDIRNHQFPTWVGNLPTDELAAMETPGQAILNAVRHETSFRVEELDLRSWKAHGGDLRGTPYEQLWERL